MENGQKIGQVDTDVPMRTFHDIRATAIRTNSGEIISHNTPGIDMSSFPEHVRPTEKQHVAFDVKGTPILQTVFQARTRES